MKSAPVRILVIYCVLILSCAQGFANIRLPQVLSDNMVLQRNSKTHLWGWAAPAEKILITTSWNKHTDTVIATGNATWTIQIPTPEAGGPFTITFAGQNTIELKNILIGEVWVCSGQSNMEWSTFQNNKDIVDELPKSANDMIRLFQVPKSTSDNIQDDLQGSWAVCGPESLKGFSAVGYFYGKQLAAQLKVPIGLINTSWGGTPAEVWTPAPSVNGDEALRKASLKIGDAPWWPTKPGKSYNAMVAPLTKYDIAGAIWYQGESNVTTADTYQLLLTNMIGSWRQAWGKEFPFYLVQIAPFSYGNKNVGALLREAQTNTLGYAKTGMVVITDLVDNVKDIHPANKHTVGERLAAYALADTYKQTGISYHSPMYKKMEVKGNKATLTFDYAENGFKLNGAKATEWFVAGEDKVFYPAEAKPGKNNTIVVSAKEVKVPAAVRFGFSNEAMGNIFSKEGLPINPFRTDNWEVDTSAVESK
ncbi:MAG: sialate O-acetylesterase [Flavitalea sp.]